jgi:MYXO-CTERM domain-containing protein
MRSISILALLGVLAVPAVASATGSGGDYATTGDEPGGDVGSGGGAGSGGGEGTASPPASTGEPATSGTTTDATGATGDAEAPEPGSKGCSIGAGGTAPGLLALALLGLHGLRRRRA